VSPTVTAMIKNNYYNLSVQKQLGTISNALTLDFNFGKNIISADPIVIEKTDSKKYTVHTDLTVDRNFYVQFSN
jgi:expansin (peptidoglycan-binding protein)